MESNSYSYYRLYEKLALVSLLKGEMSKPSGIDFIFSLSIFPVFSKCFILGNLTCINNDTQTKKKQENVNNNNNNNNNNTSTSDEQNALLHFYVFNIDRERNLHLTTNSKDKRLLIFSNISNSLYKMGLRNGKCLD